MESKDNRDHSIDAINIMKVLPHRYPMLMIDEIIDYEPGVCAVSKKAFSFNEGYLQGHYPNNPIVPGTLLLEGLSQTATFAILTDQDNVGDSSPLLFTGVDKLRFFKVVTPGNMVVFKASVIKNRHGVWLMKGEGIFDEGGERFA